MLLFVGWIVPSPLHIVLEPRIKRLINLAEVFAEASLYDEITKEGVNMRHVFREPSVVDAKY